MLMVNNSIIINNDKDYSVYVKAHYCVVLEYMLIKRTTIRKVLASII